MLSDIAVYLRQILFRSPSSDHGNWLPIFTNSDANVHDKLLVTLMSEPSNDNITIMTDLEKAPLDYELPDPPSSQEEEGKSPSL